MTNKVLFCKKNVFTGLLLLAINLLHFNYTTKAQTAAKPLSVLQQSFLDLRFGMFIHFNIPTYGGHDWPDPNLSPKVFNPKKLNCEQWADAAKSAGMTYGCLTTKHHSGFCIWPTKTTPYSVSSSDFNRDVVKEYVNAFRKKGLKVFLYYSILDTHHNIRPGWFNKNQQQFIKNQLTELLTNYGEISGLIIDGWDAPWSRISYETISFQEIYSHIKSLQPNCLVMDHNAAKYPAEFLFYSDIKLYEQNAGQIISRETNLIPAEAGLPININWFWKKTSPSEVVKSAKFIVEENLIPLNKAHCNFILNVAPNTDGLIDDNAIVELKKIGQLWKHTGPAEKLPFYQVPIVASNLAKHQRTNSSWSEDMEISDRAVDDDFSTTWVPSSFIKEPHLDIIFSKPTLINSIGIAEYAYNNGKPFVSKLQTYKLQYWTGKNWQDLKSQNETSRVRVINFRTVSTTKVRLKINSYQPGLSISELMVYHNK
ncbi:alpha-L-fucosidase [Arcicella rosea]|uniref:alpha-L-fucosidase n=1 Tax=Arcicella rosea TaxID=502909 RepID=A0A841EEG0_9BACT|nr:alpha-L-fucosidase [Arcicella rosea]MBB6002547.1 alpha-L-fucosidase [Arcicella rosea]